MRSPPTTLFERMSAVPPKRICNLDLLPDDMRGDIAHHGWLDLQFDVAMSGMVTSAEEEPLHRYLLWWVWDWTKPLWLYIMLNPSKATHQKTDPTLVRQAVRTANHGGGGILVGNAGALRETDRMTAIRSEDIIGPDNQFWLSHAVTLADKIIVGHGPDALRFGGHRLIQRATVGHQLHALRITKDGHPGHPLYVDYAAPLLPYAYGDHHAYS